MKYREDDTNFEKMKRQKRGLVHAPKVKAKRLPRCGRKITYKTRQMAESTASTVVAIGSAPFLRNYQCPRCGYWHHTSQAKKTKKKRHG